jgi:adenosylcobinamide kinase/adenosylcobinamide-phosphate guanylyltransferase
MLLVTGGAYCGKRRYVKDMYADFVDFSWVSAYEGITWEQTREHWEECWSEGSVFVLEGWELWLNEAMSASSASVNDIRTEFRDFMVKVPEAQQKRGEPAVFIMLEMGRGIVPMSPRDRMLRDASGWLMQDAASLCDEVYYVWHGLAKKLR